MPLESAKPTRLAHSLFHVIIFQCVPMALKPLRYVGDAFKKDETSRFNFTDFLTFRKVSAAYLWLATLVIDIEEKFRGYTGVHR